ncbi:ferritin-3 [Pyrus ussuriensis x Pyrus communis]|uniref:Ferritin-3 n=1 Tax=Pyrus ussuriensis x Pyrus communis TaxID=2448454 RepID=A0A5N5GN99_9ROSA|nr:ferritin-3 [Pyrus ussuriensis x Pyrus communis]
MKRYTTLTNRSMWNTMSPMCTTPCVPTLTGKMLGTCQTKRGGKVKLPSMRMPVSEFGHVEKGDALYAMELALALEKLNNEKLLNLHKIANEDNDVQLVDFLESNYLTEQVFGTLIRCSSMAMLHDKSSTTSSSCLGDCSSLLCLFNDA